MAPKQVGLHTTDAPLSGNDPNCSRNMTLPPGTTGDGGAVESHQSRADDMAVGMRRQKHRVRGRFSPRRTSQLNRRRGLPVDGRVNTVHSAAIGREKWVAMRTLGIEEEFQLVDLNTRELTGQAGTLLMQLCGSYVAELQRCVVESNSPALDTLEDLRNDLVARRNTLVKVAAQNGIGVVAAGSVPLAAPTKVDVTPTARYQHILAEYQVLAREQLVCGTQVHVSIEDRDEAVAIAQRVAPYLPSLLALSASSPFRADGTDTGYASSRTLMIQRWPTTGLAAPVHTAAEYDQLVNDLVATGVIADAGMVYFDVRLANSAPTLELRICDSCPSVDTIVLIAGLFRALVDHESEGLRSAVPGLTVLSPLGRAAVWRAARSGLEGELVDLAGPVSRPAAAVITDLVNRLRPQLEAVDDWNDIARLTRQALASGTSAARQRKSLRRRGRLCDVVDDLIADTAAG
jgi:carboxylate-amine ligase